MSAISQLVNRIRLAEYPIVKHDLRARRRKKINVIRVLIYGMVLLSALAAANSLAIYLGNPGLRSPAGMVGSSGGLCVGLYIGLYTLQFFLICMLVPTFSAGAITDERNKGTFDMLATTMLSASSIILQKVWIAIAEMTIMLAATLPAAAVIGLLGGFQPLEVLAAYVMLLTTACSLAVGGVFWSCILRNTRSATLMAYASVVGLYLPAVWLRMMGVTSPASRDWSNGWMPVEFVVLMVAAAALIILSMHFGMRMTGQRTPHGIRMSDIIGTAAGLILMAFLVIRMGPNGSLFPWHAPLAVSPLSAITGLMRGEPHAWETAFTTLGFSMMGTILLAHLSVRRFHAMRCS